MAAVGIPRGKPATREDCGLGVNVNDGRKSDAKATVFRVVIEGGILPQFNSSDVIERLANLFKQTEEAAAKLLSGRSRTVKSGVDHATAIRYLNALRSIGVACRVEREVRDLAAPTQTASDGNHQRRVFAKSVQSAELP